MSTSGAVKPASSKKAQKAPGKGPKKPDKKDAGGNVQASPNTSSNTRKTPKKPKFDPATRFSQVVKVKQSSEESVAAMASMGFFSDPTSSFNELVMEYTDFFDSDITNPYWQWTLSLTNPFYPTGADGAAPPAIKVLRCSVYALPQFNVDVAEASLLVSTSVPVHPGGTPSYDSAGAVVPIEGFAAVPRTTLLTPTSVSKWTKVLDWEASKLFADSNIQPQIITGDTTRDRQVLAAGVVLQPDTLKPITEEGGKVQFMIRVKVANGLPQITKLNYLQVNLPDATALRVMDSTSPADGPILANITGIRNTI